MEADLQEHYRIDLAEAVYGGEAMSARRMLNLILGLPPTSRTMRALGDEDSAWTPEMMLAGLAVERLDALNATLVKVNGGKVRSKLPEIVPRPKREYRRPAVSTLSLLDGLDKRLVAAGGEG